MGKLELNLVDNEQDPWGVQIDFDEWVVTRVDDQKQFHKLGVQIGYPILQVNGMSVWDDMDHIRELLIAGDECVIIIAMPLVTIHVYYSN